MSRSAWTVLPAATATSRGASAGPVPRAVAGPKTGLGELDFFSGIQIFRVFFAKKKGGIHFLTRYGG